ncbi:MAG: pectate lyase [Paludibacter sp.]|nr:pectate lyase [Paludibacter sp.]
MKKITFSFLIFSLLVFSLSGQIPAFPGAYGGGMYTTGGRDGKVIYVTSLADDESEGTLRWALNQHYPRTVLFKVSGIIELKRKISIKHGDLTIAGQSAPGDGICIKDHEITINADNVIIRYMRFRLGNVDLTNESDAIGARGFKNIIVDHCSMSWSIDETASFYDNKDFTLQWCIISESLDNAGHEKGAHGYGGIWGGDNASFHHNIIANHLSRVPRFNGWKRAGLKYHATFEEERVDFRNNVVFNWGDNVTYGGESAGHYNMVGNYYKPGPATKNSKRDYINQIDRDKNPEEVPPGHGTYFITGNYLFGAEEPAGDDWQHVKFASGVKKKDALAKVPYSCTPIMEQPVEDAYKIVLAYAGASLRRDPVDLRIAQEIITGIPRYKGSVSGRPGIIDSPKDVGGYPVYNSEEAPEDTNADGIPDVWMAENFPGKNAGDKNNEGYTYLEIYLNSLVQRITDNEYTGAKLAQY